MSDPTNSRADELQLLLNRGASVHVRDETFHGTPLTWALYGWANSIESGPRDHYEAVALLVRAGAKLDALGRHLADPPVDVRFGEQTDDEMLFGLMGATKDRPRFGLPLVIAQGPFRFTR